MAFGDRSRQQGSVEKREGTIRLQALRKKVILPEFAEFTLAIEAQKRNLQLRLGKNCFAPNDVDRTTRVLRDSAVHATGNDVRPLEDVAPQTKRAVIDCLGLSAIN